VDSEDESNDWQPGEQKRGSRNDKVKKRTRSTAKESKEPLIELENDDDSKIEDQVE
jgi:hypothetical protein